jgi:hypothetical protein
MADKKAAACFKEGGKKGVDLQVRAAPARARRLDALRCGERRWTST